MFDLLKGIKVIDLTTILLGPYATQLLGDLGADVIKVEPPDGDLLRYADAGRSRGMGAAYLNCNRNKRSIVLDLTKEVGRKSLHRMVESADVLVHNMRSRSADKLGIAYESVRAIRGDIIYCYASGFGQRGRLADEPAYDDIVQALSGLAFINAGNGDEPRYVPNTVCDKIGGLHLALSVLAGLLARSRTKKGMCIETPMFESVVSFLFVELLAGKTFEPAISGIGYHRLMTPFRRPFRTHDGYVSILPYTTAQWQRFLRLIGHDDLVDDGRITDATHRSRNIEWLYQLIAEVAPTRTTAEWSNELRRNDIPCAEVNRAEDVLTNAHLADVDLFRSTDHPSEGDLRSIRSPFTIAPGGVGEDRPAPALGSDGADILREAGFSEEEIERLARSGGVHLPSA